MMTKSAPQKKQHHPRAFPCRIFALRISLKNELQTAHIFAMMTISQNSKINHFCEVQLMEKDDSLYILFIRHAETQYDNIGDRDNCDGDLTEKGEQQCLDLGQRLKDVHIDAFIASSLLRAFKTGMGVCNARPDKPLLEICPELIECGCTPGYYGCSEEYLQSYYKNAKMLDTKLYGTEEYEFACQTREENILRVQKVIDYLKNRFTYGQRVAIFSHHGTGEHLIPVALGLTEWDFKLGFANTGITALQFRPDGSCTLRYLNK